MASSQKTLRRAVMRELAPKSFGVFTTSAVSTTTITLIASSLITSETLSSRFAAAWGFITVDVSQPSMVGQQQKATKGGFDNTTGSITFTNGFSTLCASGTEFEMLSILPAVQFGETVGVREVLNDVLSTIPPIDLLPVTASTNLSAYNLISTYPWLTEKDHIIGIYYQDTGQDYPHEVNVIWDWQYDADTPRLIFPGGAPYVTGQTFYVKARRPAQTWIKTSGVWTADTDGLNSDSDEALPLLPVVRAMALEEIYRLLGAGQGPDEYAAYYREREQYWGKRAFASRYWSDEKSPEDLRPNFKMLGRYPSSRGARRTYS